MYRASGGAGEGVAAWPSARCNVKIDTAADPIRTSRTDQARNTPAFTSIRLMKRRMGYPLDKAGIGVGVVSNIFHRTAPTDDTL